MVLTKSKLLELVNKKNIENKHQAVSVEETSICLHLDNKFMVYEPYGGKPFVPPKTMDTTIKCIKDKEPYILPPKGKVLACSQEKIDMPLDLLGFIQTKGSIARGFLFAHICDSQVAPGYKGNITFELLNMSDFYYELIPGMRIASIFFFKLDLDEDELTGYNGRYQNSGGPTGMQSN